MKYLQCMDPKCAIRNGSIDMKDEHLPKYNAATLIATNLPKCPNCSNILRPNVSMFGDYDFYGKPCEYAKKKMENWIQHVELKKQKLVILEIGCGINPHSLRMNNGIMMSGEWKLPKIKNLVKTIRLNPHDEQDTTNTIHISLGAKYGLKNLLK